jgi:hypothetical protein
VMETEDRGSKGGRSEGGFSSNSGPGTSRRRRGWITREGEICGDSCPQTRKWQIKPPRQRLMETRCRQLQAWTLISGTLFGAPILWKAALHGIAPGGEFEDYPVSTECMESNWSSRKGRWRLQTLKGWVGRTDVISLLPQADCSIQSVTTETGQSSTVLDATVGERPTKW